MIWLFRLASNELAWIRPRYRDLYWVWHTCRTLMYTTPDVSEKREGLRVNTPEVVLKAILGTTISSSELTRHNAVTSEQRHHTWTQGGDDKALSKRGCYATGSKMPHINPHILYFAVKLSRVGGDRIGAPLHGQCISFSMSEFESVVVDDALPIYEKLIINRMPWRSFETNWAAYTLYRNTVIQKIDIGFNDEIKQLHLLGIVILFITRLSISHWFAI